MLNSNARQKREVPLSLATTAKNLNCMELIKRISFNFKVGIALVTFFANTKQYTTCGMPVGSELSGRVYFWQAFFGVVFD